jgi:hypothetical protein
MICCAPAWRDASVKPAFNDTGISAGLLLGFSIRLLAGLLRRRFWGRQCSRRLLGRYGLRGDSRLHFRLGFGRASGWLAVCRGRAGRDKFRRRSVGRLHRALIGAAMRDELIIAGRAWPWRHIIRHAAGPMRPMVGDIGRKALRAATPTARPERRSESKQDRRRQALFDVSFDGHCHRRFAGLSLRSGSRASSRLRRGRLIIKPHGAVRVGAVRVGAVRVGAVPAGAVQSGPVQALSMP